MKPRLNPESAQRDLFRASFDQILNPEHPLVVLAGKIDWSRFDVAMAECYSPDLGAPAKATRLMVGLVYLKHAFNESDESLLLRWPRPIGRTGSWAFACAKTILTTVTRSRPRWTRCEPPRAAVSVMPTLTRGIAVTVTKDQPKSTSPGAANAD